MVQDCISCGGSNEPSHLPGLVKCQSCGLIAADLDISDAEVARLYDEDFFRGNEFFDYTAEQESLRLNFRDRIRVLREIVPDLATRDLFEIGCAYGFFLDEVHRFVHSASGIDISREPTRYAREKLGLAVQQGDYLSLNVPNKFGAVAMWDTIEHLKRPDLFLAKIRKDLLPEGILALTTGDIGSLNARLRGRKWRLIHPPTHLYYFSTDTMMTLLHRHGFEPLHVSHPGNSRKLRAILYQILALRMKQTRWYDLVKRWPLFDRNLTLNLLDIMFVIARRR